MLLRSVISRLILFLVCLSAIVLPAVGPMHAQQGAPPRLAWSFSEGGDDEVKLGLAAPDDQNYAGVWMSCRRRSGVVMLNIQLQERNLPAAADAVRGNKAIEVTLKGGREEAQAYPGLGYDQHDGIWQLEFRLDAADPVLAGLAASGRLETKGRVSSHVFMGTGMAKAWPQFAAACRAQ
jgi:hypothetical protein